MPYLFCRFTLWKGVGGKRYEKDVRVGLYVINLDGEVRSQGPDIAIHHSEEVLLGMNAWSQVHHQRSGLTQKCRESTVSVPVTDPPLLLPLFLFIPL